MAAPTPVAVSTQTGIALELGYQARMGFSLMPAVPFWVISSSPPGLDGGAPVPTSTEENLAVHTFSPRGLTTITPIEGECAYDPVSIDTVRTTLINKRGTVTYTFPDGTTVTFYGYLQHFKPGKLDENGRPTASFSIQPTNWDPVNHVEAAPVIVNVPGT